MKSVLNAVFLVLLLVFPLIVSHAWNGNQGTADVQDDLSVRLMKAADYFAGRYDGRVGLVSESESAGSNVPDGTPCNRTFWIYSDNLWASEVLEPFYPAMAQNISDTVSRYVARFGSSGLFEVALGTRIVVPLHANRNVSVDSSIHGGLNYTVWGDRHKPEDGAIFYDEEQYADLVFYVSLNYFLDHNNTAAERWFRIGEAMWTGQGFLDEPANSSKSFQNYKLGLYLLTAKVTGFNSSIRSSVEAAAWSCQIANGGIASTRDFNGALSETANVETTSALLLSYTEKVVASFKQLKIGAYYYIWYGIPQTYNYSGTPDHWKETIKGTPNLGNYSSDNATIADIHIQEALNHSVDFFAVSWFGRNGLVDHNYVDTNLQNGLLKAEHMNEFNFCLMYESQGIFDSVKDYWLKYNSTIDPVSYFRSTIIKDIDYAADHYFNNPSYLHVHEQPVLFIYNLLNLPNLRNESDLPKYPELNNTFLESVVDGLRSELLTNKSVNVYLVGDIGNYPPPSNSSLLHSMNATTSYFFSDPRNNWTQICNDARTMFPEWSQTVNSEGVKFIPNAYPGFNSTGLTDSEPAVLVLNETGFKELLSIGKQYADSDPGIIMVTSWNEWREGTSIEPSKENGALFLDAIPEFPILAIFWPFMVWTVMIAMVIRRSRRKARAY